MQRKTLYYFEKNIDLKNSNKICKFNIKRMISVIMSVHNGENYISSAIKSILDQTYREFEFIIVNDGSIDKSLDVIKSFKDSRIKIINKKHSGLTKSLNLAIAQSKFNLLARQVDDFSYKRRLELQIKEFNKK